VYLCESKSGLFLGGVDQQGLPHVLHILHMLQRDRDRDEERESKVVSRLSVTNEHSFSYTTPKKREMDRNRQTG
jgi:hypothetical protein